MLLPITLLVLLLIIAATLVAAFLLQRPTKPADGSTAPDFTLRSQDGSLVSLKDLRGKWVVLYFYPKDQTPG